MVRRWLPLGSFNPSRHLDHRHSEVHEQQLSDGATIAVGHGCGGWMGIESSATTTVLNAVAIQPAHVDGQLR
jgi:hypothetical protein